MAKKTPNVRNVYLVNTRPTYYVLQNDKGKDLSQEVHQYNDLEALTWARRWCSDMNDINLTMGRPKTKIKK